jgi:pimeloyl-ACP methyl ester carboxylesterase
MLTRQRAEIALHGHAIELEFAWVRQVRVDAPLIVFLHEGLGSLATWGDWPVVLCEATGCNGLVYSRYGYGGSTARPMGEPWRNDYLEQEALELLPALLLALDIDATRDKPVLFGHSDGGSIALMYAAAFPASVAAVVAVASHLFTEPIGLARIRQLQDKHRNSTLRAKLAAVHDNPNQLFQGWSELWLSERFRGWDIRPCLRKITCSILAVQGDRDEYGTLAQLDEIVHNAAHAKTVVLAECGHFPHVEQATLLAHTVVEFLKAERLVREILA